MAFRINSTFCTKEAKCLLLFCFLFRKRSKEADHGVLMFDLCTEPEDLHASRSSWDRTLHESQAEQDESPSLIDYRTTRANDVPALDHSSFPPQENRQPAMMKPRSVLVEEYKKLGIIRSRRTEMLLQGRPDEVIFGLRRKMIPRTREEWEAKLYEKSRASSGNVQVLSHTFTQIRLIRAPEKQKPKEREIEVDFSPRKGSRRTLLDESSDLEQATGLIGIPPDDKRVDEALRGENSGNSSPQRDVRLSIIANDFRQASLRAKEELTVTKEPMTKTKSTSRIEECIDNIRRSMAKSQSLNQDRCGNWRKMNDESLRSLASDEQSELSASPTRSRRGRKAPTRSLSSDACLPIRTKSMELAQIDIHLASLSPASRRAPVRAKTMSPIRKPFSPRSPPTKSPIDVALELEQSLTDLIETKEDRARKDNEEGKSLQRMLSDLRLGCLNSSSGRSKMTLGSSSTSVGTNQFFEDDDSIIEISESTSADETNTSSSTADLKTSAYQGVLERVISTFPKPSLDSDVRSVSSTSVCTYERSSQSFKTSPSMFLEYSGDVSNSSSSKNPSSLYGTKSFGSLLHDDVSESEITDDGLFTSTTIEGTPSQLLHVDVTESESTEDGLFMDTATEGTTSQLLQGDASESDIADYESYSAATTEATPSQSPLAVAVEEPGTDTNKVAATATFEWATASPLAGTQYSSLPLDESNRPCLPFSQNTEPQSHSPRRDIAVNTLHADFVSPPWSVKQPVTPSWCLNSGPKSPRSKRIVSKTRDNEQKKTSTFLPNSLPDTKSPSGFRKALNFFNQSKPKTTTARSVPYTSKPAEVVTGHVRSLSDKFEQMSSRAQSKRTVTV